jgi:hypothetical protein
MSFEKAWYTVEGAQEKFGVEKGVLLHWVEDGLVRTEEGEKGVMQINAADLELLVQERTGI